MSTVIWVAEDAAVGGTGAAESPYNSIQAAIDAAEPGATIMVQAGTYVENLDFTFGGTEGAPITLVSADGPQAAVIIPADPSQDTIQIDGHDHITIDGFELHGSSDDTRQVIHIHAVDGNTDPATNIAILNNFILRGEGDGIKVSKSADIVIEGNTISGGGDQESGIDFVGVVGAIISNNVLHDIPHIGIMIKGGSKHIALTDNTLTNIGKSAIEIGGYSNLGAYPPGFLDSGATYEAANVLVSGNTITDSGSWALRLIGAQGVAVLDNVISGDGARIRINDSDKFHDLWFSDDIGFFGNAIDNDDWLKDRSDRADLTFSSGAEDLFDWWADVWFGVGQAEYPEPPPSDPEPAPVTAPDPEPDPQPAPPDNAEDPGEFQGSGEFIAGTNGEDELDGTSGSDLIDGGAQDDRIEGREGDDTLLGGDGSDELRGGDGSDLLLGEAGDDRLEGDKGQDTLIGGDGRDELRGGDGDDLLLGEADDDRLRGDEGQDTLIGGLGDDRLEGDKGADWLYGGDGADEIRGGDAGDFLSGGAGQDKLEGDDGDDTLIGGAGDDLLDGGNGRDQFHFTFDAGIGTDEIKDFTSGEDLLVFEGFGETFSDFSDLDTDGDGHLTASDAGVSQDGGSLTIDLFWAFGASEGSHVIHVEADSLSADDFVFLA